jgi:putative ATP-binding cassette transporter
VRLKDVEVRTPDGRHLVKGLDMRLEPGDWVTIKGRSGGGKTILLESLAGMWPYASGSVRLPADAMDTMFVSQLPYLPLGNLRDIAAYPSSPDAVSTDEVQQALLKVALPHLIIRINEIKDCAKVLSVGEQQRIAFARILLNRPMVVFLDEATSGLDEGLELTLYQLLRAELPQSIVVSVSHRDTVEQHHDRQLELLGDGAWRLDRLTIPG